MQSELKEMLFVSVQQLRTSEGLEVLLGQVGASMAPGKQQALQVNREGAKHAAGDGVPALAHRVVSGSLLINRPPFLCTPHTGQALAYPLHPFQSFWLLSMRVKFLRDIA
jgi:hypothetical protein